MAMGASVTARVKPGAAVQTRAAEKREPMWDLQTIERMNDTTSRDGYVFVVTFVNDPERRERFSGDTLHRAYQWALANADGRAFNVLARRA